jgi:hypothetical protein
VNSANASVEPERSRPERIGRRIGITLFWLLGVYVIGMSAASIIPALYFPGAAPKPPPAPAAACAEQLRTLQRELLAKVASTIERGDASDLDRWLAGWDKRSLALTGGCGALEAARKDLLALRAGLGSLLASYRSGPLRVKQRLDRVLDQLPEGGAERPKS